MYTILYHIAYTRYIYQNSKNDNTTACDLYIIPYYLFIRVHSSLNVKQKILYRVPSGQLKLCIDSMFVYCWASVADVRSTFNSGWMFHVCLSLPYIRLLNQW